MRLSIARKTVEKHVEHIQSKLGAENRTAASINCVVGIARALAVCSQIPQQKLYRLPAAAGLKVDGSVVELSRVELPTS